MSSSHLLSFSAAILFAVATGTPPANSQVEDNCEDCEGHWFNIDAKKVLPTEIVITATKRDTSASKTAGNFSLLSQSELSNIDFDHISDALNRLPGTNIQHGNGQEHLTSIRSPVLNGGAGAGSFLYLEDGIPLRSPGFANVNGLFEAHSEQARRIEVVRGPGSALYGSNAVHGMVNVISGSMLHKAIIDYFVGPHAQMAGKLGWQTTSDQGSNIQLQGTFKHDDGYRDDSGYDQQKGTIRWHHEEGPHEVTLLLSGHNLNQETAGFIYGLDAYKDEAARTVNTNPEAFRDAKAARGYLRWDSELPSGATLSLTPYFRITEMEFLMHFLPGQALEENGHRSAGFQTRYYNDLNNGHAIIVGLDAEYTKGYLKEVQDNPSVFSFVQGVHFDYDIDATLLSPYLHTEWQLGEDFRLTVGVRADYTEYDYTNNTGTGSVGRYNRSADRKDDFTTVTPKLGFTWQVGDEQTIFGAYARGQRAPQTTDLYRSQINQVPGEAKPETADSFEIGLRDAVGTLRYEITAYHMKKENYFFRDSAGWNVTDGETLHRGVELQFNLPMSDYFTLAGSGTHAIHTYEFNNAASSISSGDDIDTAPRLLGNLRLAWTPSETFRAELEWVHMDKYFTNAANTQEYEGHDLFNLRMSYEFSDNLQIYGRIHNVTDEAFATRADFAFGNHRYFPGEKRGFYIGFRKSFE